jgi:2-polyprenyl-3-methyl-5-hydroxy-6-metoxy-1,4-benzoquinol methylase
MKENGTYYTNQRPEMLKYIPADTRVLLDVGCGEGTFSRALKTKGVTVWGIEPVVSAAEIAKAHLDHVLQGSIEERMKDLPDHHFDCIIFNDVLEHLLDPEQVLTGMKQKLTANGCIVCSIPNVRNWRNIRKLLIDKDWKYEDSGTLDRTHLRFFTLKSLKRMFNDLGFEILKLDGINSAKSPLFHVFNLLFLFTATDTKYLQFACLIKPKQRAS